MPNIYTHVWPTHTQGEERRAIRETHMNQASSRSHSIFQLVLEQELPPDDERMAVLREQHGDPLPAGCILRSKLNLVDLAGRFWLFIQ